MTIRIFIGTSPNSDDLEAELVLDYTLHKYASEPLDITWMRLTNDKTSPFNDWDTLQFQTPFSPFRWCIPELCNFKGRAIYMDVDTICMADIAELYNQDMYDKAILCNEKQGEKPYRTCVSLWDCGLIKTFIPSLPPISCMKRYKNANQRCNSILEMNTDKVGVFKGKWNSVDLKGSYLGDPGLKVIHCSAIAYQPHQRHTRKRLNRPRWFDAYNYPHPRPELEALFDNLYIEAQEAGYKVENYIPKEHVEYRMSSYKNRKVK